MGTGSPDSYGDSYMINAWAFTSISQNVGLPIDSLLEILDQNLQSFSQKFFRFRVKNIQYNLIYFYHKIFCEQNISMFT